VTPGNEVTPGNTYTVDEAFQKAGFGRFHWKILLLCGAMVAVEAVEVMLLTFLIPMIAEAWNLESPWDSMIGASVFIGSFSGIFLSSYLSDVYGRRNVVIGSAAIIAVNGTITTFVTNLFSLLICRFVTGIGVSGGIATFILFQEMVPHETRGWSITIEQQCWTFGAIFSVLLAWSILPNMDTQYGWRVYVGLSVVPAWIVLIGSKWIPESVRWYCTIGEFDKAESLIQQILKENGKEPMRGRLVREEMVTIRGKISDMFVPKYYETSVLIILTFITTLFCYYSIVFVSERLFDDSSLYVCEFVTTLAELPAIVVARFMDRIGRKCMFTLTWTMNTIGFSIIAILWHYMSTANYIDIINAIVVFIVRLSVYLDLITIYLFASEYYPTAIRTTAVGFGFAMSRLGATVGTFVSEDTSVVLVNVILTLVAAVSCIFAFLIPEDTTGRILTNNVDRTYCETSMAITPGEFSTNYVTV
jgi:putative MFS transporter